MRSLPRFVLLSGLLLTCASPSVLAQGLKINPYPVEYDGRVLSDHLDANVVRDLIARQNGRSVLADAPPVVLKDARVVEPIKAAVVSPVKAEIKVAPKLETVPVPSQMAIANGISLDDVRALIANQENMGRMPVVAVAPMVPAVSAPLVPVLGTSVRQVPPSPVMAAPVQRVVPASSNTVMVRNAPLGQPVLDRVTVIVHPRGQQVAAPILAAPRVAPIAQAAPVSVMPAVAAPSPAALLPALVAPASPPVPVVQTATRALIMQPVAQRVTALDHEIKSVPAQLQEQALMRGVQAQQITLVSDPLDGVLDAKPVFAPTLLPLVPTIDNSEVAAVALLAEADQILDESIARRNAEFRNDTVALPGGDNIPAAPRETIGRGNKIVYSEANLIDVITGISAAPAAPVFVAAVNAPVSSEIPVADVAPISLVPLDTGTFWSASAGENAYDVLMQWSRSAGVDLIWDSEFLVDVRDSVDVSGGYADAVTALLEQYQGLRAGVEGVLYVDDQSGRKTLLIQTNGQG